MPKKKVIKSAKDGEFKSKEYAATHPATTYRQTVNISKGTKKKQSKDTIGGV